MTSVMWSGMQQCSDRLKNEPPPPPQQQQQQEGRVTGSGVVLSSIPVPAPGAAAGQAQQQAHWLSELSCGWATRALQASRAGS
jgi:hypothetical protein